MGMMDMRQKGQADETEDDSITKKCCVDCKTTKTPLWRGGPAGPKSLCNACGIRFRKRRISTYRRCDSKRQRLHNHSSTAGGCGDGEEVLLVKKQRWRKLPEEEEEQAAVSLMALSCGSVFA